jgi:hypothetical protein
MSDEIDISDIVAEIGLGSAGAGTLARDAALFADAVKVFRSRDGEAWNKLLARAQLLGSCHEVCRWVCSKECVRLCILLAGAPSAAITLEQIAGFPAVLERLAKQPKLIEQLARAVEAEDSKAFAAVVDRLDARAFAHLLCHWVCFTRCHVVCRVLCERAKWDLADLVAQLRETAVAVASLASQPDQLKKLIDAAARLNCAAIKDVFGEFQDCRLICRWICSWRCLLVCLRLTQSFQMGGDFSIEEMRAFAQFCAQLTKQPNDLEALVTAIVEQDDKAFVKLVKRLKADKFVHQLCHWVCHLVCHRFCICVCPPPGVIPIFDHVGAYRVDPFFHDFTADGTTTAGGYAFTGTIPLIGLLPPSPVGNPIEYRFTVQKLPGGAVQPLTAAEVTGSVIGSLEFWEWDATALPAPGQWKLRTTDYTINNAPGFYDIQQDVGPPLHIQVTTPIAADGWVRVPTDDNLTIHGGGKFVATHLLAALDTTKLTLEQFDLHGPGTGLPIVAGASVPEGPPAADNRRSEKPVFTINFEARKSVGPVANSSNSLPKIALSNTRYAFDRHPDWAGSTISLAAAYPPAVLLDIKELRTVGGCSPLSTVMTAEFTAFHPYLASCHLYLEGPTPPLPATLPDVNPAIDANGQAISPAGGLIFDISALHPCAYILWLKTTLNLTSGYGAIGGVYEDHIAFCVH